MEIKKNSIISLFAYLILYIIGATLVIYLIAFIVSKSNNIDINLLLEVMQNNSKLDLNVYRLANFSNALGNFIVYLIMFIVLIIINFKNLKEHLFKIKNNLISFIIITIFGFIILYGITYLINYLYNLYNIGISNNQDSLVSYIEEGNAILIFFSVFLFAPIVEELIYRYVIFDIFTNRIIAYIVSIVFFALPHMLSTNADIINWLLLLIPYLFSGFMLALIYDQTKNIYASIFAHMLNNLVSFISIIITLGVIL